MICAWLRAMRHRRALRAWGGWTAEWGYKYARGGDLRFVAEAAEGYFTAGDWLGVESCYLAARRVLERRRDAL